MADDTLTERLVLRLSEADAALLRRTAGPLSRSLVAREAMKIGLKHFARHPEALLRIPPRPPGPKPKRRRED